MEQVLLIGKRILPQAEASKEVKKTLQPFELGSILLRVLKPRLKDGRNQDNLSTDSTNH